MSALSGIASMARATLERMAASRRRRQTIRLLESLPPQILRDIGYGSTFSDVANVR